VSMWLNNTIQEHDTGDPDGLADGAKI